jgi:hypothetical protein
MKARDIETSITESMGHEERAVVALETIAFALTAWVTLEEKRFEKEYPVKPEPRDARITHIPTSEERLRKEQGSSSEPIEEWIGLREQQVIDSSLRNQREVGKRNKPR